MKHSRKRHGDEERVKLLSKIFDILTFFQHRKEKKEERIQSVVNDFMRLYRGDGRKLKWLIPSGFADLENDKEISLALTKIGNRTGGHPLRAWKDRAERRGYKRFFSRVIELGIELNPETIEKVLSDLDKK